MNKIVVIQAIHLRADYQRDPVNGKQRAWYCSRASLCLLDIDHSSLGRASIYFASSLSLKIKGV